MMKRARGDAHFASLRRSGLFTLPEILFLGLGTLKVPGQAMAVHR